MHIKLCIDLTKCETKFVRLLFRFTFQNCNLHSWEVFIFFFLLNVFLTYCLKVEKCLVNYRKIKSGKNHFIFLFLCRNEKNKFDIFSVSLYVFHDIMCYRWLKICYKEPYELMFIYVYDLICYRYKIHVNYLNVLCILSSMQQNGYKDQLCIRSPWVCVSKDDLIILQTAK